MLRGRFTRSQGRNRNPNNLHIIPIGSVVNNKPVQLPPSFAVQQQVFPSVIPVLIPPASTSDFFDDNINYQGRYNKGRRKRKRKRDRKYFANKTVLHNDYRWINPTVVDQTNSNVVKASEEKVEMPEVPPSVEEDFEEVEVASSEGEGKKIPVGFRKTKLHYLNYKKNSFFKPKFYDFSSQRTVVNCLNIEDDVSVDVDVVSEAEYDECETDILDNDFTEKFGKIIEIEEESSNEITDEGEEETVQDVNDELEDESNHIVTDEIEESAIVNEESNDTVIDEGDKISTPTVADKLDEKSVQNVTYKADQTSTGTVNKVDEKSGTCAVTNEVGGKSSCTEINIKEKDILDGSNKAVPSTRIYKTCIEGNDGLSQGKSLIQDKLDVWESHLIGLQYLLEIRDKSMVSVLKYYCVLCDEDLDFQELPELYVINHVNGRNHVKKYLEKHFSTSGYDLSKNNSYDFVVIQKLCEKINENLGYYFLCITSNDYFIENNSKIKGIIQNASHPNEIDFKIDKNTFEKTVDSDLSENINNIIKNIVKKVIPKEEITTEMENVDSNNTLSERKLSDLNAKKKPAFTKPRPKYRGNNAISSFLRLRFAENTKLGTSSKESSNKSKKMQNKDAKLNEQNVKDVKSHNEKVEENVKLPEQQQNTENTKLDNKQVVENVKSKNDQVPKSPVPKNVAKNVPLTDKTVLKTFKSKNVKPEVDTEIQNEHLKEEEKNVEDETQNLKHSQDNSKIVVSHEGVPNVVKNVPSKKVFKNKEKVLLKTTIHSKHCRKRILDKGITRLRLAAAKATTKGRLITEVSNKSNVKCKSVTEKVGKKITSQENKKKIIPKKIKPESKESKLAATSPHKKKPLIKVISVQKSPVVDLKSSVTGHTNSHLKSAHKKSSENSAKDAVATVSNDSSHWIPMRATSPVLTSDISLFLKKIAVGSPVKKRRLSKSPIRKITSPLRLSRSYSRKYSKSPHRKRDSKSPVRRKSRSPYRKLSKSPGRRSRSPVRRRSRSPLRHHSRSPAKRRSRSPRRRSRSPRRRSRSPARHRSRSPFRRQSRSPLRRHSRSPGRKRSRSPLRIHSRSPLRRYSRSPLRRHSRSPLRRHSRSPLRRRSRSPMGKYSRSPVKRRSRSPQRRYSRSPTARSRSPGPKSSNYSTINKIRRNLRPVEFSSITQSSSSQEYYSPNERYHRNAFDFPKRSDMRESEMDRSRDSSKILHSSKMNKSDKYKSQTLPSISTRDIDLDSISDEDESLYFSDKHLHSDDTNISPASKMMFSKFFQKLPGADNTGDPALNNMLQFMEAHKAEIEEFIALKSTPKSEKALKIDSNLQQQTLLLQQYLLSHLAGNIQESVLRPSVSNMQYAPSRPPFVPESVSHTFQHPTMPPQANMSAVLPQSAPMQPRFFPPNVNVPPPHLFHPSSQPSQNFSPKPKPATEVMFKDLKATVNKLFGANEVGMKQGIKPQVPSFVTEPDPEKWDLNHPNAPKFNVSLGPKNIFPPSGKNINFSNIHENPVMREQLSSHNSNAPGQFFSGNSSDRPQIPEVPVPPPNAKVTFCDSPRNSSKGNLFPVVNPNFSAPSARGGVNDVKVSLAQRLASVLVKIGMVDVPAPLLQEMLMKIGAFSSSPRQDISENEIVSILKRLGYLS